MAARSRGEVAERMAAGMVAAWRDRVRHLEGHVIHKADGIVVCLSNLPDDEQNVALADREPKDAFEALSEAERVFVANARKLAVDVERGRHPVVEKTLETMGLEIVATRPGMAIPIEDLEPSPVPVGVEILRVADAGMLASLVDVEVASFGTAGSVADRLLAPSQLRLPNVRLYAALVDGRAVAQALTNTHRGAVGIFGVGTLPELRGRGIGAAITAFAIGDVRDDADLAWLQSSEMGRPLYERMGFRQVATWQVWARAGPGA